MWMFNQVDSDSLTLYSFTYEKLPATRATCTLISTTVNYLSMKTISTNYYNIKN